MSLKRERINEMGLKKVFHMCKIRDQLSMIMFQKNIFEVKNKTSKELNNKINKVIQKNRLKMPINFEKGFCKRCLTNTFISKQITINSCGNNYFEIVCEECVEIVKKKFVDEKPITKNKEKLKNEKKCGNNLKKLDK